MQGYPTVIGSRTAEYKPVENPTVDDRCVSNLKAVVLRSRKRKYNIPHTVTYSKIFYEVKRYILAGHLGRADLFGLTRTADSVPAPKSPDRGKRVVRTP